MVFDIISDILCSVAIIIVMALITFRYSIVSKSYYIASADLKNKGISREKYVRLYKNKIQDVRQKIFSLCFLGIIEISILRCARYQYFTSTMATILICAMFLYVFKSDIRNIVNYSNCKDISIDFRSEYKNLLQSFKNSLTILISGSLLIIVYSLALGSYSWLSYIFYIAMVGIIYYLYKCLWGDNSISSEDDDFRYSIPKTKKYQHPNITARAAH
jgi:hypothetical protein